MLEHDYQYPGRLSDVIGTSYSLILHALECWRVTDEMECFFVRLNRTFYALYGQPHTPMPPNWTLIAQHSIGNKSLMIQPSKNFENYAVLETTLPCPKDEAAFGYYHDKDYQTITIAYGNKQCIN